MKKNAILKKKQKKNSENDIKLDYLHTHFNTLLRKTSDDTDLTDDINQVHIEDVELDSEINEQEIQKAVFKQKTGKACGPDDIF